jgi:PTH1 family peptidyl-tRNA hydrolase
MVLDELGRRFGVDTWKKKDDARQALVREKACLLVEPLSFMNLSGEPTRAIAAFHKVAGKDILVVADDLDLPFGKLRFRWNGSAGGHNGLKSLIGFFGEGFPRLKVGIGRSRSGEAISHVLGAFDETESQGLPAIVAAAADGVERWLAGADATQFINTWKGLDPQITVTDGESYPTK